MVDRPDRLDPVRRVGEEKLPGGPTPQPPGPQPFEKYMEQAGQQPAQAGKAPGVSPFELPQATTPLGPPTFDSLLGQVKSAQGMLGDINSGLQTKNLKLKPSQRYLLRNKLTDANAHLQAANAKMGAEVVAPPPSTGGGIMGKFLDYVAQGQTNLAAAQQQIGSLKDKGMSLKPADFLAVQLKLAHAQQEIEYASIMLSQAVKDMQTLFGVQL